MRRPRKNPGLTDLFFSRQIDANNNQNFFKENYCKQLLKNHFGVTSIKDDVEVEVLLRWYSEDYRLFLKKIESTDCAISLLDALFRKQNPSLLGGSAFLELLEEILKKDNAYKAYKKDHYSCYKLSDGTKSVPLPLLLIVAYLGHAEGIKRILAQLDNKGEACLQKYYWGMTAVHYVAQSGDTEAFEIIFNTIAESFGRDRALAACLEKDSSDRTVFSYAVGSGNLKIIEKITIMLGKDEVRAACVEKDLFGMAALHHAVLNGDFETFEKIFHIISSGLEKDRVLAVCLEGRKSVFHYAAQSGNLKIFRTIIDYLGDQALAACLKKDSTQNTILYYAAQSGNAEIFKIIIDCLGKERASTAYLEKDSLRKTVLDYAAESGNVEILEIIINYLRAERVLVAPLEQNFSGKKILQRTVKSRNLEAFKIIFAYLGDQELITCLKRNSLGFSLLDQVVSDLPEAMEMIVDCLIPICREKNNLKLDLLGYAISSGNVNAIRKMLSLFGNEAAAACLKKDSSEMTFCHHVAESKKIKSFKILVDFLDVRERLVACLDKDYSGRTPLHYAAMDLDSAAAEIIEEIFHCVGDDKASVACLEEDCLGNTVIDYLLSSSSPEIVEILNKIFVGLKQNKKNWDEEGTVEKNTNTLVEIKKRIENKNPSINLHCVELFGVFLAEFSQLTYPNISLTL